MPTYIHPSSMPPRAPRAHRARRATIAILLLLTTYVLANSLAHAYFPNAFIWVDEDREEAKWLASSRSWWDRKACRFLAVCGLSHYVSHFWGQDHTGGGSGPIGTGRTKVYGSTAAKREGQQRSYGDNDDGDGGGEGDHIPSYVMEYAPLVWLHSKELFWPCHISDHIAHTTPHINYTRLSPLLDKVLTTSNIGDYLNNSRPGAQQWTFMHSNEDPEKLPAWMLGWQNIPTPVGAEEVNVGDYYPGRFADVPEPPEADEEHIGLPEVQQQTARTAEQRSFSSLSSAEGVLSTPGRSNAPVILIVVPKADGVVDAFWFFFYSFNEGTSVMNIRFGNHVGDWEHTLIRFKHGKPQAAFLSAHSNGEAYSYDALEKRGKRPIIYSAAGTHAMYTTPGHQFYGLPWGLLHDTTDRGKLWDPSLNTLSYTYDPHAGGDSGLRASTNNAGAPCSWFYFAGHWGDKFYRLADERQYRFVGQYHYVNGPLGPRFKDLERGAVCPDVNVAGEGEDERDKDNGDSGCVIRERLERPVSLRELIFFGDELQPSGIVRLDVGGKGMETG